MLIRGPMDKRNITKSEANILKILSADPMITQEKLAEALKTSRSSVSVHLNNLVKKGYILGRGYLLNHNIGVTAIGASMIDITGHSLDCLIPKDSNPGKITVTPGGVTRNISENLALLKVDVTLITALCNDGFGYQIKKRCEDVGIDISFSYFSPDGITTTYMAILDDDGDMALALSDTTALDNMPLNHLLNNQAVLNKNELIVIDAALPDEIITYIVDKYNHRRLFVDPVSIKKAQSIKDHIGKFDTLKCNEMEAQYLSDINITDKASLEQAANYLLSKGLKNIFITRGKDGAYYQNAYQKGYVNSLATRIESATGAGDAFTAGIVYAALKGYDLKKAAWIGNVMASIALQSISAVNPMMSLKHIALLLKKEND